MRVVVVGAGIAGLALAQGLMRRGLDVVVLERDRDLAATGGYKPHLAPEAVAALRQVLPPALLERVYGCSVLSTRFVLAVRDHRGRLLLRATDDAGGLSLDIDRVTLRLILATGLGHRLRTGIQATGYRQGETGAVVVTADGEVIAGDVVVIADGAGSPLAAALAGGPTATFTGLVGVAGRADWHAVPHWTRQLLADAPVLAIGPGGAGLFASLHDPDRARAVHPEPAPPATEPTVIWGVIGPEHQLRRGSTALPDGEPAALATALLRSNRWAPGLVGLPELSHPASVAGFPLLAADPDRLAPWAHGRVTAVGDAVHVMPPTGGRGAGTAIRDAAALTDRLAAAAEGECTIPVALFDYTARMRRYAAAAVRESVQPVRWIRAGGTRAGRAVSSGLLPALAGAGGAIRAVRRR